MKTSNMTLEQTQRWIDDHQEELVSELQDFSRIRSVSRADLAVVRAPFGPEMRDMLDFALMRAAGYGFDTQNHEGYCGSVLTGSPNKAIGIFGHLDVVPEGDGWKWPPYGATRTGDFLIGRGVADNKSACVMGLMLMRMFKDLQIPMRHGLRLVLGCSEETGMPDMEYFAQTQVMPEVSLVPDARFPVCYAQKGMLKARLSVPKGDGGLLTFKGGEAENMVPPWAEAVLSVDYERADKALADVPGVSVEPQLEGCLVRATGVAAHAAGPESGKSAIHMLAEAIIGAGLVDGASLRAVQAIADLSSDYYGCQAGIDGEDAETGKTTLVCGLAQTREGKVLVSADARLSIAADLNEVERSFRHYAVRMGFGMDFFEIKQPFYMGQDDARVQALMDVYCEMTGDPSPAYTTGGGTYSRCLKNAITFGPGFPAAQPVPDGMPDGHGGAHAPDEYMHIPTYLRAMQIYAAAI